MCGIRGADDAGSLPYDEHCQRRADGRGTVACAGGYDADRTCEICCADAGGLLSVCVQGCLINIAIMFLKILLMELQKQETNYYAGNLVGKNGEPDLL